MVCFRGHQIREFTATDHGKANHIPETKWFCAKAREELTQNTGNERKDQSIQKRLQIQHYFDWNGECHGAGKEQANKPLIQSLHLAPPHIHTASNLAETNACDERA
mmetsp:Transcript_5577/g.9365  ORF Transcript_5577/g.9365 Transcript_5577/m.9365 type:complete len:106 (-) Transcript_5577:637-954(-)